MYNIGHRKEIRISEVKRYLWSLRKRGGFHENRKKKKDSGDDGKITRTATYI